MQVPVDMLAVAADSVARRYEDGTVARRCAVFWPGATGRWLAGMCPLRNVCLYWGHSELSDVESRAVVGLE